MMRDLEDWKRDRRRKFVFVTAVAAALAALTTAAVVVAIKGEAHQRSVTPRVAYLSGDRPEKAAPARGGSSAWPDGPGHRWTLNPGTGAHTRFSFLRPDGFAEFDNGGAVLGTVALVPTDCADAQVNWTFTVEGLETSGTVSSAHPDTALSLRPPPGTTSLVVDVHHVRGMCAAHLDWRFPRAQ